MGKTVLEEKLGERRMRKSIKPEQKRGVRSRRIPRKSILSLRECNRITGTKCRSFDEMIYHMIWHPEAREQLRKAYGLKAV